MNKRIGLVLAILAVMGFASAQNFDFSSLASLQPEGEPLSPVLEAVQVSAGQVKDVGTISTEKPSMGIIRGEIQTHLIGGYAAQGMMNVVAVPAGETYWNGAGTYTRIFALLSNDEVLSSSTIEYGVNREGIPYGGPIDYYVYKTTAMYNPSTGKTEFALAYNISNGGEAVDLYLE